MPVTVLDFMNLTQTCLDGLGSRSLAYKSFHWTLNFPVPPGGTYLHAAPEWLMSGFELQY